MRMVALVQSLGLEVRLAPRVSDRLRLWLFGSAVAHLSALSRPRSDTVIHSCLPLLLAM